MVEAGHNVVPQGGDVWETQSNMTELPESDGNIPIGPEDVRERLDYLEKAVNFEPGSAP